MEQKVNERREKMRKLQEKLLAVEEDRRRGAKGYTVDEVVAYLEKVIEETKSSE